MSNQVSIENGVINLTNGGNVTAIIGASANVVLTFPPVTDVICARSSVDVMTNKTITAASNNVAARALVVDSGAGAVSTYVAAAPTAGQVLTATGAGAATWQTPSGGGGGTPGGPVRSIQFNDSGSFGGSAPMAIDTDGFIVTDTTVEATATGANFAKIWGAKICGGRAGVGVRGEGVWWDPLQPAMWSSMVSIWYPQTGTTAFLMRSGNTATGTATSRPLNTSTFFRSLRRIGYVTTAAANVNAGVRHGIQQWWRGNGPSRGGFTAVFRFGISSAADVAGQRSYVGMIGSTTAFPTTDPSSNGALPMLGFCVDNADDRWFVLCGSGGSITKTNPGVVFPPRSLSSNVFEFGIHCKPNDTVAYYSMRDLESGLYAEGVVSSNLPSTSTFLSWIINTNTSGSVNAAGIDVMSVYVDTPY